jgi:hypothetical protein
LLCNYDVEQLTEARSNQHRRLGGSSARAHHPIGFVHADCLPDTAGYSDPNDYASEDDKNCKSYGLAFGSTEYAACRVQFTQQHRSPEPVVGFGYSFTTVNHR